MGKSGVPSNYVPLRQQSQERGLDIRDTVPYHVFHLAKDGLHRFRTYCGKHATQCKIAVLAPTHRETNHHGDVAELADALDLGSSSFTGVQVRFLSSPLLLR